MKHGNFHTRAELTLDVKTFGCFDVFQNDATKRWLKSGNDIDEFFGITFIDLKIEGINISKLLHEHRLAFRGRLGCQCTDGS